MVMPGGDGFYFGSRALSALCPHVHLSLDQLNFVACQLFALVLSIGFRKMFNPATTSASLRHSIELAVGIGITYFCFGYQVIHIFVQSALCYAAMFLAQKHVHQVVFGAAMLYLSLMHIYRQVYDYAGYTLDITGPLMIITQKITSLAFSLHDGMVKPDADLTDSQRKLAVKVVPSITEYMSYVFSFHNVLCGPLVFYNDYIDFIHGYDIGVPRPVKDKSSLEKSAAVEKANILSLHPGVTMAQKFAVCVASAASMMFVMPLFPTTEFLTDPTFLNSGFFYKMGYSLISLMLTRSKYYFAWTLGELTSIAAGLGFGGYDSRGREKWDTIKNADIYQIEFCTSLKVNMDSWNIRTQLWLRHTVYDRCHSTMAVFLCSAFWHGFYPGYYLAFGTAALFVYGARNVRRCIRPYFQRSKELAFIYDCITFVFTRLCNVYMVAPFMIYEFLPSIKYYASVYCWLHVLAAFAVFALPVLLPVKTSRNNKADASHKEKSQ